MYSVRLGAPAIQPTQETKLILGQSGLGFVFASLTALDESSSLRSVFFRSSRTLLSHQPLPKGEMEGASRP